MPARARLIPPPGERALPIFAGALLALAYPPVRLLLPAFVGLAPLLVFIADRPAGLTGRWAATRAAMLTGLIYFGVQLYWLAVALVFYSRLAIPAYLLTVLVLTGLAGGFGWALHYALEHTRIPLPVLAAVFWTTLEWIQGNLGDIAFPWLGLGTALAPFPLLAGAADIAGARGLTFWIAAINGLVATLILRHRHGRPLAATLALAAGVLAAPIAYSLARAATLDLRPVARVALVQPNIPEELKLDRAIAVDTSMTALTRLTSRLDDGTADLVVWPEVAVPTDLEGNAHLVRAIRELSATAGAPILAGAYGTGPAARTRSEGRDGRSAGEGVAFNSAFLVTAADQDPLARYDKRRLVPFVERVPFIDPAILGRFGRDLRHFGGLGVGTDDVLFDTAAGARFGVLICYESIFAGSARRYRRAGADFLVNVTNDAWYGREPWWARTTALWQHPAHLVMRAIETRTGIARAANTGISMFVDPLGRTYQRTPLFQPELRIDDVLTTDAVTLYVRRGDWLAALAVLAAIVILVAARRRSFTLRASRVRRSL